MRPWNRRTIIVIAAASSRRGGIAAGGRAGLSEKDHHPHHRPAGGGQRHRHRRAASGAADLRQSRPADDRRQSSRRGRAARRRAGVEGAGRRLHADPRQYLEPWRQSGALRQAALRSDQGFRADRPRRPDLQPADREFGAAVQDAQGRSSTTPRPIPESCSTRRRGRAHRSILRSSCCAPWRATSTWCTCRTRAAVPA